MLVGIIDFFENGNLIQIYLEIDSKVDPKVDIEVDFQLRLEYNFCKKQ